VGGPIGSGGLLQKVGECECCTCWVNDLEPLPQLSDTQLISGTQFNNIKVGEVPINTVTFYDKYMVDVEQMSLSKHSFDFFKLIRKQKETASSLFQPPAGEIRGNINAVNNNESVVGIFWASSIMKKTIFIQRSDVPYNLPPTDSIYYACTAYPNSSNVKPKDWQ
jgi:thiamine biosynthesis protein ThiC